MPKEAAFRYKVLGLMPSSSAAARLLRPKGQLVLVANRHLPYEADLELAFSQVTVLVQEAGFKVIHARSPKRAG